MVELFTLITFPLMLAACPNHRGSLPEPQRPLMWLSSVKWGEEGSAVVVVRAENRGRGGGVKKTKQTIEGSTDLMLR